MVKFYAFLIVATISIIACGNSGIKFGLDTNIFKALGNIDFNKYFQNKTLTPAGGIYYNSTSFPSYQFHAENSRIVSVQNPSKVDVISRQNKTGLDVVDISLENLSFSLETDFQIKVVKILNDKGTKTPIKVSIDKVLISLQSINGTFTISALDIHVSQIDIKFNSIFFKFIYWVGNTFIRSKINLTLLQIKSAAQEAINNYLNTTLLYDIGHGSGLGLNLTIIDKPDLISFNKTNFDHLLHVQDNFLAVKDPKTAMILTFGVHGSLYAVMDPTLVPKVEDAVNMDFPVNSFNNKFTLLLSDYTLNTLFYMGAGSGLIKTLFKNDTSNILPFNLDTQGISSLIPEFATKFENNTVMDLKLYISALDHVQPSITTGNAGTSFSINFGVDFLVYNDTEPFADPANFLRLNVTSHFSFQTFVTNNKLNIIIFQTVVDSVDPKIDLLEVDKTKLVSSMNTLINQLLTQFKSNLTNIDVLGFLQSKTGLNATSLVVRSNSGYYSVSLNANDL